jgi:type I restriction enzyme R subunit
MFRIKAQLAFLLQGKPELEDLRHTLVADMARQVQTLDRESFAVRQHLKYVELYANPNHYTSLTRESTLKMALELAPLIRSTGEDAQAVRFDTLIYGMELAYLLDKESPKARADLLKHVRSLNAQSHIPEIAPHKNLIHQILQPGYLEDAGVMQYEQIRRSLRDLLRLLPGSKIRYTSNFSSELPSIE